jgi:hypothetical protein
VRTVVYQSFRTHDVPAWISRCLETVKSWAAGQGFVYRFYGDEMFGYAPGWYREKVADHVLLVSDLARLEIAKELLNQGYERTIWVDADVVVFAPRRFVIDVREEFSFCREVWLGRDQEGGIAVSSRVANAVSVFVQQNHFLDFYIHACLTRIRHKTNVNRLDAGTDLLSRLHKLVPFPLIETVGLFSPLMHRSVQENRHRLLRAYMQEVGRPLYAANLCGSLCNHTFGGFLLDAGVYDAVIDVLLRTRGEVINRHCPPIAPPEAEAASA